MKHLTRTGARWPTPIYLYYAWELRWENGKPARKLHTRPATEPVAIIASQAQAHALQRKALKQSRRFFSAVDDGPWLRAHYMSVMQQILQIEPGAAYFYAEAYLGTRKVSRIIPSDVLVSTERLTALESQMRAEAKGSVVTVERRLGLAIAIYDKPVYVKVLRIIPKACVEKSKCSNG